MACQNVEKTFYEYELVPDVLLAAPRKILNVSYPSGVDVNFGDELTPTQVKDEPKLTWELERDTYYTLIMIDPDAPSRSSSHYREFVHWIVMNIPESSIERGNEVIQYVGSGPPKDSGLHRYTFLLYKQPHGSIQYNEPHTSNKSLLNRIKFSTMDFAKKYRLGDPEYGNFFQAQYDPYSDVIAAQLR